jgi:hypothetical protein
LAFFVFLALTPLMAATVMIYGLVADPNTVQAQMASVDPERATTGSTGRATHRTSFTPRSEASYTESAASARSSRRLQRSSERTARSSSLSARGAFSPAPNSVSV